MPRQASISAKRRHHHDLITTAGNVGLEAARLLAQRAEPVRVLVRDSEKTTALAGVEVAEDDLGVP
jgi:putative NADH-flavin reductase